MDEYIKRSEILKHKRLMEGFDWDGNFRDAAVLVEDILKIKATDVAPVRHGRWVTHSDRPDSLICSVCKCGFDMWKHDPHNYCPNCGADMRKEKNDGGL